MRPSPMSLAAAAILLPGYILFARPLPAQEAPPGAALAPLLAAGRALSPALQAAALDSAAAAARAEGADALDDPGLSDSYQYYRDPGVFSGHVVMFSQSFPLWGKRDLRRQAALAEAAAWRGRERAAGDELEERIKLAFARYDVAVAGLRIDREALLLIAGIGRAAAARYGAGRGDQPAILQSLSEESAVRMDIARLDGERRAAAAQLNALTARAADAELAEPEELPPLPAGPLPVETLLQRAAAANPGLQAEDQMVAAARNKRQLADKAWLPDVSIGAGPILQTNGQPPGLAVSVGVTLPLGWGRQASEQKASAAEFGAAERRRAAAWLELQAGLGDAAARLTAARDAAAVIEDEALPRAHALLQSLIADYGQGRGDLAAAVMALHRLHDLEMQALRYRFEAQSALAAIERLIGGPL